ncbi:MAG TPA: glycosyltransferase family 39 protein [Thermoanaerobaculia bacterium]
MDTPLANASQIAAAPAADRALVASGTVAVVLLALAKLVLHLATTGHFGYSYFVDELYFLACSHHLAWGFVDMPPLFPALTALVRVTLGDSLLAIRLVAALAGAALVLMTGLLARDLGGRRFAQTIAALAVITAPVWMALHSLYTMNALDQLFWTAAAWLVVRIVRDDRPRLWRAVGAVAGFGLLNKHTMAFFGVAVVLALLATRERRAFRSPWLWAGGLVALALFLPNLIWIVQHHFPHFEMLANIKRDGRDVDLSPPAFLLEQVMYFNPLALPLWVGGLVWLLRDREGSRFRVLGLTYLFVLAEMFVLHGRPYYPAPAYPMLFAAGGVWLERFLAERRLALLGPAYATTLALSAAVLSPLFLPLLPPALVPGYSQAIGIAQPRLENHRLGPLPQLLADRFGWREMAEEVARVYRSLPPEDRAKAAIFGQFYGQAGAIDLFGPRLGLPPAISGHLTYYLWGPRGYTGDVMIVLDDRRERLLELFRDVRLAGHVEHPYSMPYNHFDVYVCRGLRMPVSELWPLVKKYR